MKKLLISNTILLLIITLIVSLHITLTYRVFPYHHLISIYNSISKSSEDKIYQENFFWAEKVIRGGYILHFRHAQREKWEDVTAFDAIELKQKEKAENQSYKRATCLTQRGIEEAKIIGEIFTQVGVEISEVISSGFAPRHIDTSLCSTSSRILSRHLVISINPSIA
jgi:hypothetical protein